MSRLITHQNRPHNTPMHTGATPKALQIGRRDIEILQSIEGCLCLSTSQIGDLFFSSVKKASERLKELVGAGYLKQGKRLWHFAETRTENFYSLAIPGRELLIECGHCDEKQPHTRSAAPRNLNHLAAINQVSVLLRHACRASPGISAVFVPSWNGMGMGPSACASSPEHAAPGSLKPDAAIWLANTAGKGLLFFLEVDCETEPVRRRVGSAQTSLQSKLEQYCLCFDNGDYRPLAERLFKGSTTGFRVLLVTTDQARVEALRRLMKDFGDTRFVWATTFADLQSGGVLGPIWQVVYPGERDTYSIIAPYVHPDRSEGELA